MLERSGKERTLNMNKLSANDETESNEIEVTEEDLTKNPAAVALGRLGGKKGGKARAAKLSAKRRSEIARIAAQARWGNRG